MGWIGIGKISALGFFWRCRSRRHAPANSDERIVPADWRMEMNERKAKFAKPWNGCRSSSASAAADFMKGSARRDRRDARASQARVSRSFKRALGAVRTRLENDEQGNGNDAVSARKPRASAGTGRRGGALPWRQGILGGGSAPVLSALAASAAAQVERPGGLGSRHQMFYRPSKVMIAYQTLATAAAGMSVVMTAAVRISASGAKVTTANQARAYDSASRDAFANETTRRLAHFAFPERSRGAW
jgi:hypothetical protein